MRAQRPLSIMVIAIYMLFGACSMPGNIYTHSPAFLMGLVFRRWSAILFFVVIGALDAVIGIGLLRLAPWSRIAAIYFFLFRALNLLFTLLFPNSRASFKEGVDVVRALRGRPPLSWSMIGFGAAVYLCIMVAVLWFLVTRKEAFCGRPKPQLSRPPMSGRAM
jgi:hypothetical protein